MLNGTMFSKLTALASVVVFYRVLHEWEVGTEPPFTRGIRYPEFFGIILSNVYSKLKLQRGRWIF